MPSDITYGDTQSIEAAATMEAEMTDLIIDRVLILLISLLMAAPISVV